MARRTVRANRSSEKTKAIFAYVLDLMPAKVKKAREKALFNLYHGAADPEEDIGDTWAKNAKIVDAWWDQNMGDDLIVDENDEVMTVYEFERGIQKGSKSVLKEEKKTAIDEGFDDGEDVYEGYEWGTAADHEARRRTNSWAEMVMESSTRFDARDVKRIVLPNWP